MVNDTARARRRSLMLAAAPDATATPLPARLPGTAQNTAATANAQLSLAFARFVVYRVISRSKVQGYQTI